MDTLELKKMSLKDQASLFRVNLFYYAVFTLLIFLNLHNCNLDTKSFNSAIKMFNHGGELSCQNTFVSKKRGWSIDTTNKRFVKTDRFIDLKTCIREYSHER